MIPQSVRSLIRKVPTVAPVPHRSVLSVTGSQAGEFLNGVLASSVLASQGHFFSAFLHAQGRVLHDVFVYSKASPEGKQSYLIEYDPRPSEAPPLLSMLKRYVLRSKVRLRDVSDEYDIWQAWGSEEDKYWETDRRWNTVHSGAIEPIWDGKDEWPWGREPNVIRDRRAVGMGRRLLVRKGDRPQYALTHDLQSQDAYTLHRILHGVPEGNTDISPTHAFPMDSNLDIMGGLDFRKGCYVGQELTVRTYHTGLLRKRVLPVVMRSSTSRGITDAANVPAFPTELDIRIVRTQHSADSDSPKVRPRGTGKLLSSIQGVGLALLRLEHVQTVERGEASFQFEMAGMNGESNTWTVEHWHPFWWPALSLKDSD